MALQQAIITLIDTRVDRSITERVGTAVTPAYRWYDYALRDYLWVMDVDLDTDGNRPDTGNILKAVPIADASHGVHKAGPSARVRLRRIGIGQRYEITGLASIVNGQVTVFQVTYGASSIVVGSPVTFGSTYRPLNYSELGDSALNGGYLYGELPYGTLGKYDANGDLVRVLTTS